MTNFTRRLGYGLMSASGDPAGQRGILAMNQAEADADLKKQASEEKAEQLKKDLFLKLYESGVKFGADENTLNKLLEGAGVQPPDGMVGGIVSSNKKKQFLEALNKGDWDAESINDALQSGYDTSKLKASPPQSTNKNAVLSPGSQLVDPSGKVLANNPNMRQPAGQKASFKEKLSGEMEAEFETLKSEVGQSPRLSDRLRLAEAKTTLDVARGIMTPSAGDKRKAELGRQFETLARFDNSAETALNILREDQTAATVTADMARAIRSTATNAKSLFNLIPGVNIKSVELDESGYSGKLAKYAGDNNQLRSVLFNVALLKAAANGLAQGKMSNQMISMMIDDVGASARSPQAIARKLEETRSDLASALEISTARTLGDFGRVDQDPTQPQPIGAATRTPGGGVKPIGTATETPGGGMKFLGFE